MYRYLIAGCTLIASFLLMPVSSTEAQRSPECQRAIQSSIYSLQNTPDLQVTNESRFRSIGLSYPDRDAHRTWGYVFVMEGRSVSKIFNSPQLLINLAEHIISDCGNVAKVTFARSGSGENLVIGLFTDGQVMPFQCAEDFGIDPYENNTELSWGMQFCSL